MSFLSGFSFGNNNEDEQKQQAQAQAAPVNVGNPIAAPKPENNASDDLARYIASWNARTGTEAYDIEKGKQQAQTVRENQQWWQENKDQWIEDNGGGSGEHARKPVEIKPEPVEAPEPEQVQAKTEKPEISKPEAIPEPVTETVPEVKPVETQQIVTTNAGALASGQNEKRTETPLSMANAAEEDLKKNKGSVISGGNGVISNPIGQSGAAYRAPNHGRLTPVKAPNSELSTALGNFSQAQGQNGNPLGSVPTATGNQRYYTGVQSDRTGTGLARDLNQVLYGNPLGREGHRVTEEERQAAAMQIAENRFNPNPNATRFDLQAAQNQRVNNQAYESLPMGERRAEERAPEYNGRHIYKPKDTAAAPAELRAEERAPQFEGWIGKGNNPFNQEYIDAEVERRMRQMAVPTEPVIPAVDVNGNPNQVLQTILDDGIDYHQTDALGGAPMVQNLLHMFDNQDDGTFQGITINPSFADIVAPTTFDAMYQSNVNQDPQHTQTVKLTPEQYKQKFQAFVDANPAIDKLLEAGKITEEDVMLHFFKNIEIVNNSGSYGGYRYTPRTYYSRGGGGGGYSGYRSGGGGGNNSYSQAYNQNPLTVSRVFNVMKNWEF